MSLISNSLFFLLLIFVAYGGGVDVHATTSELLNLLRLQRDVTHEIFEAGENKVPLLAAMDGALAEELNSVRREFEDHFSREDDAALVSHPLNLFHLYRHWTKSEPVWRRVYGATGHDSVSRLFGMLPDSDATDAVALTLVRLQSMYNMTEADISAGDIRGYRSVRALDKGGCFHVARVAHAAAARDSYRSWHHFCMSRHVEYEAEREAREEDFEGKMEILDSHLQELEGLATMEDGDAIKKVLENSKARDLLESMRERLPLDMVEKMVNKGSDGDDDPDSPKFFDIYNRLCQLQRPTSSLLELQEEKCVLFYSAPNADLLSPYKLEFHSYSPLVATIHDVLSDRRIDELVSAAAHRLEEPKTISSSDARVKANPSSRTGKVAFLEPLQSAGARHVSASLTGLDMAHAESLQVVAYGVGGQYEPHRDYFGSDLLDSSPRAKTAGDRIATLLYYLSDVQEGGSTVFPSLGLAVHPQRGSALFWYNLFRNGTGDEATMHAGCPVLIGSKWIANQWFRERGQEHARKCDLEHDL